MHRHFRSLQYKNNPPLQSSFSTQLSSVLFLLKMLLSSSTSFVNNDYEELKIIHVYTITTINRTCHIHHPQLQDTKYNRNFHFVWPWILLRYIYTKLLTNFELEHWTVGNGINLMLIQLSKNSNFPSKVHMNMIVWLDYLDFTAICGKIEGAQLYLGTYDERVSTFLLWLLFNQFIDGALCLVGLSCWEMFLGYRYLREWGGLNQKRTGRKCK